MGWEQPGGATFPTPVVGEATKLTSFAIRVMDDLLYLKDAVDAGGSGGSGANSILNGSFEAWSGGLPSGFVTDAPGQIYSGGSVTEETSDHAHGESALKITASSPSGGAALISSDFFLVSKVRPLKFSALYKASVSTVWSKVVVYWYTAAQTASTVRTTDTIWFTQSSPTSYTYVSGAAGPPSDARYAKLMIVGGDPAGTSAGSAWFDDVIVNPELPLKIVVPEGTSGSRGSGWGTVGSPISLPLPILSANSVIRLNATLWVKGGAVGGESADEYGSVRMRVGSSYSNAEAFIIEGTQVPRDYQMYLRGVSGTQTFYLEADFGTATLYPYTLFWEVLNP